MDIKDKVESVVLTVVVRGDLTSFYSTARGAPLKHLVANGIDSCGMGMLYPFLVALGQSIKCEVW